MTFPRKIGLLLLLIAVAASVSHAAGLELPSLRWFFSLIEDTSTYNDSSMEWLAGFLYKSFSDVLGYGICLVMAVIGLAMLIFGGKFEWNPVTLRRFARFRSIGRGWLSFRILLFFLFLALLDQALVGKRALAVKYNGKWTFPAFVHDQIQEKEFGGEGEQEADYRELQLRFKRENQGNRVILPPVPFDPVFDSQEVQNRDLEEREGRLYLPGKSEPYQGQAVQFHKDHPKVIHLVSTFRRGVREGNTQIYDQNGEFLGRQIWNDGKLVESLVDAANADAGTPEEVPWVKRVYPPASPTWHAASGALGSSHPHYLGTESKGWDILAILYGGMQVLFKSAFFFILVTYSIGILIGGLMGFFGGSFDLVVQRIQEVLENMPLLLVIMVVVAFIGPENVSMVNILLIYCCFSWIGVAVYVRTSTYREKARDYVAAARVQGAGTLRVIFKHILPNSISTLVTLLPFSVSSVVTMLTALDFLGFGLPERYPSWGRLLNDGTSNLNAPWIVSSVFVALVALLLLITFVGEAIREAFDPKKFTTYR